MRQMAFLRRKSLDKLLIHPIDTKFWRYAVFSPVFVRQGARIRTNRIYVRSLHITDTAIRQHVYANAVLYRA